MKKNYLFRHLEPEFAVMAKNNPLVNLRGIVINDTIKVLEDHENEADYEFDALFFYRRIRLSITYKEMAAQLAYGKPLIFIRGSVEGIIYEEIGDHRLEDALVGRTFEHGIYDCGSAVRSYYWQRFGILIRDMPRDYGWWEQTYSGPTKDLYSGFIDRDDWEEFFPSGHEDLKVGDIFTYARPATDRAPATPAFHAGVYNEHSVIFHHPANGTSQYDMVFNWFRRSGEVKWYRYKHDLPEPLPHRIDE